MVFLINFCFRDDLVRLNLKFGNFILLFYRLLENKSRIQLSESIFVTLFLF